MEKDPNGNGILTIQSCSDNHNSNTWNSNTEYTNTYTVPLTFSPKIKTIRQEENQMAEVDTTMLAGQHADIRREAAVYASDIRYNNAVEHCKTNDIVRQEGQESVMVTKDARHDVISANENSADRIVDRIVETRDVLNSRFFDVGRDTQDLKAQIVAQQQQVVAGFLGASKDIELNALKTQLELSKQSVYLSDKIDAENEKTRALINDLKYHDLNRGLVERNTELVCCEQDRKSYRDRWFDSQFQGQWAQLQSQVQAFQSQLQETRLGMVNFGTMSGQSGQQTSTSNNVR
jgi:hypothetical protein